MEFELSRSDHDVSYIRLLDICFKEAYYEADATGQGARLPYMLCLV
jgi:hypothetical protein